MSQKQNEVCPHCGETLVSWVPADESTWGDTVQQVCFNDACPYFVKGWDWMQEQYAQKASYRFRYNPKTGEKGPLPVWSHDALKSGIIQEEKA